MCDRAGEFRVSLQAQMALLGHISAEMSMRYGRLFDATVRARYEKASTLAKSRPGPAATQTTPYRPRQRRHRATDKP
jgi:hypothetical protein